jgi:hypothetical protein
VIRVFADREKKDITEPGTVVEPLDLQLSFFTDSAEDAEKRIRRAESSWESTMLILRG